MFQEGVKPGEETRMPMVPLPVPSLPPTMTSCSCIRISYCLRVIYLLSVHLAELFKISDFFLLTTVICCLANILPLSQTNCSCSGLNDRTCIWCEFICWWNIFSTAKNSCFAPCKGILIPESRKILLMEHGIQLKESRILLMIGIQNARLSWIPLHGVTCYSNYNIIFRASRPHMARKNERNKIVLSPSSFHFFFCLETSASKEQLRV